eukprot:CCRYP_005264-RA/>CCRYP_005264-RA protein AED:0.17 eAED:-0.10 QI:0/0/0/1/1/1/2/0/344
MWYAMKNLLLLLMLITGATAYKSPIPLRLAATTRSSAIEGHDDASTNRFPYAAQGPRSSSHTISDRRKVLSQIGLLTSFIAQSANSQDLDQSILETRILENSLSPPPYRMEATDIFYPTYFQGSWKASSKTCEIYAPCGFELFPGGKAGYDSAVQKEIKDGEVLEYKARFVQRSSGGDNESFYIAADREYNAKEIAKAAMGSFSVVDVPEATPNRFSCILAPPEGSGGSLVAVDILAIARKYEIVSPNKFCCSEVLRQIASPASRKNPNAPPTPPLSVKEIETSSVYTVDNVEDSSMVKEIKCKQRTATFLVPSQTDPKAFQMWQISRGQPVDVRYYDVTFSRN